MDRRTFVTSLAACASAGIAAPVFAGQPWFYSKNKAVAGGADVVAYFTENRLVSGSAEHKLMWKGADWYFSNAAHREAFEMNPMAYMPQYGGYCAYAVSRGYTASVVPEAWQIVGGKLYLCYSMAVQTAWQRNVAHHIASADANWPAVLKG